ncbi:uracil-xanthine permease [Xenorhabdus nematophila]|uniref:Purine/xanthine transport protein (NCS2 family) n=1 Tax=Xenorhabdus nematophila (strain ATCC 19061 / DSM 3370 / CCUG 14189 / LMG 1036 / NCIMB 9965 / AN6) TaxID=406817 RepID=D3VF82_XENNA|nr:uracil-xanthine permease family protein [Xenorhabdus nematophila]CEE91000.1 putative purine/xanthine transport protein (NCS2 family) [Xenorhabdus nematophila str. Anatoliense]CEF29169.1 putative purine/xanthine transport protein (NCS2 family) [Xenorhabdus nematophila str. Websteri]AYA41851.1 uracil-xanthine permease [Xenorhabdus nematophila]KHD29689.1 xanthine permease XanP [Xenorhabdus nematophila]MBA0020582.1 uracil-xanthine permease [Xenorhabdus nematophila]
MTNPAHRSNSPDISAKSDNGLIYRLEDKPPLPHALFAACQHLLAMFVAVITPPMLICQALGLPEQDTQRIISMSLFASGLASLIQIRSWGPIGSGLLSIQGTSFNFVAPLIMGGLALKNGGADIQTMMAGLFGTLMLASITEVLLSRVLHLASRIITPLVSGIVVMIIGLSLIQVGLTSMGGGYSAIQNGTFGAPQNLLLAGTVLAVIVLLNRQKNPYLRVASLVIAMTIGYLAAWYMGMLPSSTPKEDTPIITVPLPFYYGLSFDWNLLIPLILIFMVTSLETIGDITATSDVSEQPVSGPLYMKRIKGGVLANGLNSMASAVFNTFPNSCFGQNNGVIQLTGVASRYVGYIIAIMLILLGLFPAVAGFVQHIPEPVLGGATVVMFGTIAASGIRIVSREPLNRRAIMIIALSLAVGLGVSQQPLILQFAPDWMKNLLSSGIASGGITAILLNLIFPQENS